MKAKSKSLKWVAWGILVVAFVAAGMVLAADVTIDDFTQGPANLSRSVTGTTTSLVSASGAAMGGYRMMILDVTQANSGQATQWGVNTTNVFLSLSIPSGDRAKARLQWDGNDNSTDIECATGLGGVDLTDSGNNSGIVVRVISSDDEQKNMTLKVYTDCDDWRAITQALPEVDDEKVVDILLPFDSFGGTGTMNWASVNAIELEIDGTLGSGSDVTVKFIKTTGTLYEYGDLPVAGTGGLPSGQTGFSTDILSARHIPKGMRLGYSVDTEANYQSSVLATGDDSTTSPAYDDEDGVSPYSPTSWSAGSTRYVTVRFTGCSDPAEGGTSCWISGWIDWNHDGDFDDANEELFNDVEQIGDGYTRNGFGFNVPAGASFTDVRYYARFRICDAENECDSPTVTNVTDGEVEDYAWDWGTPPTAVDLTDFSAAAQADGSVQVTWETATELDNLGFNLYRAEAAGGPWTQLNAALIPVQTPGATFGNVYTWSDSDAPLGTVYYRLEDLDVNGTSTFHGPISVTQESLPSAVQVAAFGATPAVAATPLLLVGLLGAGVVVYRRR